MGAHGGRRPSGRDQACPSQAEMMIGREAVGAALFRGDAAVSRRHAVLRILDGTCVAEDHNSTNGTFVDVRERGRWCQPPRHRPRGPV